VPRTKVVFYREADGAVPVLDWFDALPTKAQDKCRVKIQRLAELGHELRRPEADLLRDGIHELRVGLHHVNYRILYFFHRRDAAILAHGLTKQDSVPEMAIETALQRKRNYEQDARLHTFSESHARSRSQGSKGVT
jgi:phage-related protein